MAIYVDTAIAQFENVNSLRSYPFSDGCSLVDRTGRNLPSDVIVDAHVVVPSGRNGKIPDIKVTSVHLSPYMVSVCLKSDDPESRCALSAMVAIDNFAPYRPYSLEKLFGTQDAGGVVTFGDIEFPGSPETYFLDRAVLHPCCVASSKPAGLRSFYDTRSGERVRGDVEIKFSGHISHERNGKKFSLALEDGSAAQLASECNVATGLDVCGATPISSINGVRPDEDGNIVLWFH